MDYEEARKLLLADGWQTAVMHRIASYGYPVCYNHEYSTDCNGYYEIEDCSGTGMGYCSMFFMMKVVLICTSSPMVVGHQMLSLTAGERRLLKMWCSAG